MKTKIIKTLFLTSILAARALAADEGGFGLNQESLATAQKTLRGIRVQLDAAIKIIENTIYPNLATYGIDTQSTTPTTLIDFMSLSGSLAKSLSGSFGSSTFTQNPYFSTLQIIDAHLYIRAQFSSSNIIDSKSGSSSTVPIFEPFLGKRIILVPMFNISYDSNNKIIIKDQEISGWECLTDADDGIINSGASIAAGMRSVVSIAGGVLGSCQYVLASSLDALWSGYSASGSSSSGGGTSGSSTPSGPPIIYLAGTAVAAHPDSHYTPSMFSAINLVSLRGADLDTINNNNIAYWFNRSEFILPASAGTMVPIDWFVANPNASILDYCTSTWYSSGCNGAANNGNLVLRTSTGALTTSPTTYEPSTVKFNAHPDSYYTDSMFSSTNLNGLSVSSDKYGAATASWYWYGGFILPLSAGNMSPIDWFIAHPDKRIVDYCTSARYGSNCYGSTAVLNQ